MGCRTIEIQNMQQKANPTEAILVNAMQRDYKLSEMLKILQEVKRPDIFSACGPLIGNILE